MSVTEYLAALAGSGGGGGATGGGSGGAGVISPADEASGSGDKPMSKFSRSDHETLPSEQPILPYD